MWWRILRDSVISVIFFSIDLLRFWNLSDPIGARGEVNVVLRTFLELVRRSVHNVEENPKILCDLSIWEIRD